MKRVLIGAVLLVAACKPAVDTSATTTRTAASTRSTGTPAEAAPPAAPIGSKLSASVSPLTGTITGFSTRTSDLGTIVALDADVLFDFDKAVLRPDAEAALRKAADLIRAGGAGAVAVDGFTDAKGDDAYNLDLSRRRAQAVANWLLAQPGLRGHALAAHGKGEAEPVAPNTQPDGSDDPAGRAKNRRVEITIPKA